MKGLTRRSVFGLAPALAAVVAVGKAGLPEAWPAIPGEEILCAGVCGDLYGRGPLMAALPEMREHWLDRAWRLDAESDA